jgi:hypothetical protein
MLTVALPTCINVGEHRSPRMLCRFRGYSTQHTEYSKALRHLQLFLISQLRLSPMLII